MHAQAETVDRSGVYKTSRADSSSRPPRRIPLRPDQVQRRGWSSVVRWLPVQASSLAQPDFDQLHILV
ncbi:MAG: hypothetical protein HS103_01520 [Anaerolineales bacterium]|nr:hypothetical protein [Anaerolineales bacterium]